jgi:hypothetical protein
VATLQDYSADHQREQPVNEPRFSTHGRRDLYANGGLSSPGVVEPKHHESGRVVFLVDNERDVGAQPAVPRSSQAEVVTFSHLDTLFFAARISPRPLEQKGFGPVFGCDRDSLLERADCYVVTQPVGFIDRLSQPTPAKPRYGSSVCREEVTCSAVSLTFDYDLALTDKIAFEGLAGRDVKCTDSSKRVGHPKDLSFEILQPYST